MTIEQRRAGFWRRTLSLTIDGIFVCLPFQLLAAVLFTLTAGTVQFANGITYITCEPVTRLPANLMPAPPTDANVARDCQVFFFGAVTARTLSVSRVTKNGATTRIVTQSYMLDKSGTPVGGISLNFPALIVLLLYLVLAKARWGATVGDRITGICLIATVPDSATPLFVKTLLIRYLVLFAPLAFVVVTQLYFLGSVGDAADKLAASNFLMWSFVAAAPAIIVYVFCVVQVARKRDPLYDRIAGTAVVRRKVESPA
jgi:uncharacterized RDD family membrane protein YckC